MNNGPGTLFELPSQRMYSIDSAKGRGVQLHAWWQGRDGKIMDEAIRKGEL